MDFDATESNEEVQPNRRESRNEDMRAGYDLLRSRIPCLPQDQNIPRIKTLSLANAYIKHLANVLSPPEGTQPLETDDFASIVRDELQTRNNYSSKWGLFLMQIC
ncbi:unnamed protein product [Thelazia callipaeda]|uniref:BHLH domain-containing protein n=1 Tax=Thelazia callipaeda TaxID=103827 RepID=A0A0N5CLH5_THECL|nr:unnamed protein product [Thelazia callipaeda]